MSYGRRAIAVLISALAVLLGYAPTVFAQSAPSATAHPATRAAADPAPAAAATAATAAATPGPGYWLVASDGGIFSSGDATFHGSTGGTALNEPIVGIAATPTGHGYWLVASDGGIFSFGDAAFHGSTGAMALNKPIVGIAATPTGNGYWLVASDGGIFSFGDAAFHGSTGAMALNKPIVGIAATPTGNGYWLVASDGGIFSFGDAAFHGSTGAIALQQPIVGMAASHSGQGYWLVAADGGIFSFGDAVFHGSAGAMALQQPIVGMAATATGNGYWFVAADGGVFAFGDAKFLGAAAASPLAAAVVGMAASQPTITAPAPATQLAFTTEPSGSTAAGSAFATSPAVTVQDVSGATVATDTSPVQLSITAPDDGGAVLHCTANPVDAVAGVATFPGCSIDKAGTYTLTATDGALSDAVSTTVEITPVPTAVSITSGPSDSTGGVAFATQPVVHVVDTDGNTVGTDTSLVQLTIVDPAGAVLTCAANPTHAVAGVATFSGCSIDKAGTYTLRASVVGLTPDTETSTITVGPAAQLGFTTQPSGATSLVAFATQPHVAIQDLGGNTVVGNTSGVTLSIATPAGATLTCTPNDGPLAAVAGVATFAGCHIDKSGSYTLRAVDGALAPATSASLSITAAGATHLAFTTQPSTTATGGVNFAAQPAVAVEDASGNIVTTDTSGVTLSLTTPAGATLACTPNDGPRAAVAGVATFAGCNINLASVTAYTLHAADGILTAATSNPVTVGVGAAAQLAFTTQPSATATGGTAFVAQPVVTVQDAGGNTVITNTSGVTLSITTPAGATLTCTPNDGPLAAVAGVATFAGCKIDTASPTAYTLRAVDGTLAAGTSTGITVSAGAGAQLAFTTQPSPAATGGTAFTVQPVVTIRDAGGNTVTTNTSGVTLSLTTPAGAVLTCTPNDGPLAAVAGVATFTGCKIDKASVTAYTLHAADGVLTTATSNAITVGVGLAAQLAFTTQPSTTATGGTAFAVQPVVTIQDAGSNPVITSTSGVTLSLTTPAGATLTCTPNDGPRAAVAGVATFTGCSIDKASVTAYTLSAAASGLGGALSGDIAVTVGSPAKLAFTTQPSPAATGGTAFTVQPVVTVQDPGGNTVTTDTSGVTLSLTTPAGAILSCTPNTGPLAAIAGVATFGGCKIDLASVTAYTLHAVDGILAAATSTGVTVGVGAATHLTFTTSPTTSASDAAFTAEPVVAARDAGGNLVTTAGGSVTLTVSPPNVPGAVLTCTVNPVALVSGTATFSGCSMDKAGTGYTLTGTDGALTGTSTAFDITAGAATHLAFTTEPVGGVASGAALPTQPTVTVEDAEGNTVTAPSNVTLSITGGLNGATLACTGTTTNATVNGVAAFAGCNITGTADTYTLNAVSGALPTAVSGGVVIGT